MQCLNSDKLNELYLDILHYKPNFVCLTETWATQNSVESFHIPDYMLRANYCRTTFKGGGVAIFAKHNLRVRNINLDNCCIDKQLEICAVAWEMSTGETSIILTCYRSPSGDVNNFFDGIVNV